MFSVAKVGPAAALEVVEVTLVAAAVVLDATWAAKVLPVDAVEVVKGMLMSAVEMDAVLAAMIVVAARALPLAAVKVTAWILVLAPTGGLALSVEKNVVEVMLVPAAATIAAAVVVVVAVMLVVVVIDEQATCSLHDVSVDVLWKDHGAEGGSAGVKLKNSGGVNTPAVPPL
eukprot:gnl/TRDRNA2_/TRDRNA2_124060_c0_seq1.p2 gnl/TRDRNA2_/TRDRNA2_124060_c0~~gnl/TRDRNA2_/TRDRNA2_124060_c0_seq1.p2  ORF type:complete len:172 (-),score=42.46 gnl/TRDRNA2_/TRDRNA2_124060_c0_seq1:195-710(-)